MAVLMTRTPWRPCPLTSSWRQDLPDTQSSGAILLLNAFQLFQPQGPFHILFPRIYLLCSHDACRSSDWSTGMAKMGVRPSEAPALHAAMPLTQSVGPSRGVTYAVHCTMAEGLAAVAAAEDIIRGPRPPRSLLRQPPLSPASAVSSSDLTACARTVSLSYPTRTAWTLFRLSRD